jgi:hypothetical protein
MTRYKIIFEYAGAKVICHTTQNEISKILSDPTVKLISVNKVGGKKEKYHGENR